MLNIKKLETALLNQGAAGAAIVTAALRVSNDPEFVATMAHLLLVAANDDIERERKLAAALMNLRG